MSLIVYNACKAMKLLIITWVHICISFNKLIWLIQKNEKIDILSLLFMPFTGNKSPGAKKGSDEWQCDNFTNIFWLKRTFTSDQNLVIFLFGTKHVNKRTPGNPFEFLKCKLNIFRDYANQKYLCSVSLQDDKNKTPNKSVKLFAASI